MSSQAITVTAGNPTFSKIFQDTAQDGVWSGNVALDSISAQSIGILIPRATLTWVQPQYEAGAMAWRLQNAQTLHVSRWGFGCLTGNSEKQPLAPVSVSPNDILTTFPLAVAAGGRSATLVWVTTTKGTELFTADGLDNADTELLTAVNGQTIGDAFFNSSLLSITVQLQDGSLLNNITIQDNAGGVVMTVQGNGRGDTVGSRSNYNNAVCGSLNVPIGKGFKLNVNALAV
tara:strand:+ start:3613 stop:4305 length:693 start_codon:yes stop_codon:yes gene_type:complete